MNPVQVIIGGDICPIGRNASLFKKGDAAGVFRDLLSAMSERLGKIDRTILYGLAEGRRFREIAKSLQITHVSVFKHRRKIASIAVDLGLEPPPPGLKASLKKDVIEPTSNSRSV